ncbi:MAG: DUF502 domain-containing protein [Gammaproteobacteria bacterium]|nr:DUF502 domain-containing protein [Gammaproteobacteria bacterium]MCW8983039.1 DUF502 domain-containing protein [Gammaproteobacteria bacterium]
MMFKYLSKTLLTGFITLLPVVLTIYLLYWLGVSSEEVMGNALRYLLPNSSYFPGLGMLAGVFVVFVVGLMMNAYLVRKLFALGEQVLYHLPLIKSVYRAFRDFFDFFSPQKEGLGQVVAVTVNGMELVGFVTQEDPKRLPPSFRDRGCVLVYLPMSYMVGGYTLLVPRSDLRPLQMSRDEAMRFVLTAGITGKNVD